MTKYVEISDSHDGEYEDGCVVVFAPCCLVEVTDISEVLAASIIRVMSYSFP
jgi:hypothetical protein